MINRRLPNIIVPKDEKSIQIISMLLYNTNEYDAEYDILPIDKQDLKEFFKIGFFRDVNAALDLMISENEEDEIIGIEKLKKFKEIVSIFQAQSDKPIFLNYYFDKIQILSDSAIHYNTGLYFQFP